MEQETFRPDGFDFFSEVMEVSGNFTRWFSDRLIEIEGFRVFQGSQDSGRVRIERSVAGVSCFFVP
jgi:hypothetical protein